MRIIVVSLLMLLLASPILAQQRSQPQPPAGASGQSQAPASADAEDDDDNDNAGGPNARQSGTSAAREAAREARRAITAACRQQLRANRLRGQELRDELQVCRLEKQLACLKQAIGQKLVDQARLDFLRTCRG